MTNREQPIGVVLAGGPGLRIGGDKVVVALRGRALVRYPLDALRAAVTDVAVISKAQTLLPRLDGVMVWIEPDEPQSPLLGVVESLALAGGRSVLVCPADYPFVSSNLLRRLANTPPKRHRAVVAAHHGKPQPLLGCYQPSAVSLLTEALEQALAPADALSRLNPLLVEIDDEVELFDVDTPDDLLQAAAMFDMPRELYPKVKS